MIPKEWTLEGKNQKFWGDGGSKIVKDRQISFMDGPYVFY